LLIYCFCAVPEFALAFTEWGDKKASISSIKEQLNIKN
jgi:hypothetical protein